MLCPTSEFGDALRAKLDRWHREGKRIGVNWSNGDRLWTNANDKAILSLLNADAQRYYMLGNTVGMVSG